MKDEYATICRVAVASIFEKHLQLPTGTQQRIESTLTHLSNLWLVFISIEIRDMWALWAGTLGLDSRLLVLDYVSLMNERQVALDKFIDMNLMSCVYIIPF